VVDPAPKIELVFYRSATGAEPVRDWLVGLDGEARRAIGLDLQRIQYRWPVGMPLVRPMGRGLFEVRTALRGREARVLFCFHAGELYALHGFIKKTPATPPADLELARRRQDEVTHG